MSINRCSDPTEKSKLFDLPLPEIERWLAPSLNYDPDEHEPVPVA